MKPRHGWIAFAACLFAPFAFADTDPEIENQKIQPLQFLQKNGGTFCFRDELPFKTSKMDIPIPSRSARIKCSIRHRNTGRTAIGRCPRSEDFEWKYYTRGDELANPEHREGEPTEEYLAQLKKNPKLKNEAATREFRFGAKPLRDDGRTYISGGPFLKFKKERLVTEETKKSIAARRKRSVRREERREAERALAAQEGREWVPPTARDLIRENREDFKLREFGTRAVPVNEWTIALQDDDFPALICVPKNPKDKKFNMETDINVGDLYDALKSKVAFDIFPDPEPSAKPEMVNDSRKRKAPAKPKAPVSTSGSAG